MTRESIKSEVLELSHKNKNILLLAATGIGKTAISLACIDEHLNTGRVLFVLPQTNLINNTREEYIKWSKEHLLEFTDFCCYASLHKYIDKTYDLICLDEVHNCLSENRLESLSKIKCYHRVAMSATVTLEGQQLLNDKLGEFAVVNVSLSEAIENSIVSEPKINIEYIDLDDEIKRNPFKFKDKTVMMTDLGYYEAISKSITYWRDRWELEGAAFAKNLMMKLGGTRQNFLANCKEERAKELIAYLEGCRWICFCGSIEQAERLGSNVCSSKTGKKNNTKLINDFNAGKIDNLLAKNMLQEGINLVDTKYAICIQLGNQERKAIQVLGRSLRHASPEIFLLIVRNTVDERFLRESFKNNQSLIN